MDCLSLKQRDTDPSVNKRVEVLISKTASSVVYVDQDLETQWVADIAWPEYSGRVFNRVSRLERMSAFISDRERLKSIRCQIAEGMARLLDDRVAPTERDVQSALDAAEVEIRLRNRETSRFWFFSAAASFSAIVVVVLLVLINNHQRFAAAFSADGYEICSCALFGAMGAFGSICIWNQRLKLDANAGLTLHVIEAASRVTLGMIGALTLILLTKGGFLLEIINSSRDHVSLQSGFGIIAGASERMLARPDQEGRGHRAGDASEQCDRRGAAGGGGVRVTRSADEVRDRVAAARRGEAPGLRPGYRVIRLSLTARIASSRLFTPSFA